MQKEEQCTNCGSKKFKTHVSVEHTFRCIDGKLISEEESQEAIVKDGMTCINCGNVMDIEEFKGIALS